MSDSLPSPAAAEGSHEAFEIVRSPGPWVFSCEHASPRIPSPLTTTAEDDAWLMTHWGHDIGARTVSLALIEQLGGSAVLARFSRLLCDANRPPEHRDLVRQHISGHELSFNAHLSEAEVMRRLLHYHQPYHQQLDAVLAQVQQAEGAACLVSVHSFTPVWNRHLRPMDVGVLFDRDEALAIALARQISAEGLHVELNAPYSGREGLIYAADRHGRGRGAAYVELELNQALVATEHKALRVALAVGRALGGLSPALFAGPGSPR